MNANLPLLLASGKVSWKAWVQMDPWLLGLGVLGKVGLRAPVGLRPSQSHIWCKVPILLSFQLSKATLAELHQLVDFIRGYDYTSALALHTRIVEGADFATIASFMPSVKVLIQSAAQLGVYYS